MSFYFKNPNNVNGTFTSSAFGNQCCPAESPFLPGYGTNIPDLSRGLRKADQISNTQAGVQGDENAIKGTNLVTTIIKERANTNQVGASYAAPTSISQPTERDDAEKFQWGTPRIPTSSSEQTQTRKNAAILSDYNLSGQTVQVFSGQTERLALNIAQNNLTLTSATGDGSGLDLSSVSLAGIAEGIYSYLDYDQNLAITKDEYGTSYMPLVPLKEPGPPRTFNVVYNITGGVGGTPITPDLLNRISKQPPVKVHGKPVKQPHPSDLLNSQGIRQTIMEGIPNNHEHWFPLRGRILGNYTANANEGNDIHRPDRRVLDKFASRAPFTFNLGLANAARTSAFSF